MDTVFVGMEGKVAVVSSDLTAICILSVNVLNMYHVMCDGVGNSLVIMDSTGSSFAIVPQEVYRLPFSLFSLCMSTILLNADELPISLLPPRIHKLVKKIHLMLHVTFINNNFDYYNFLSFVFQVKSMFYEHNN